MLHKDNLTLKPLESVHIDEIMKYINDLEVNQYLARSLPLCTENEERWITSINNSHTEFVFGIFVKEDNKELLIGSCGLRKVDWISRKAEAGIAIFNKKYWEKKIGSTAAAMMINFAFNDLNLERIYTSAIAFNERSIALQKRLGFKEEGLRRKSIYKKGEYHDEIMLGLLRSDYIPQ